MQPIGRNYGCHMQMGAILISNKFKHAKEAVVGRRDGRGRRGKG